MRSIVSNSKQKSTFTHDSIYLSYDNVYERRRSVRQKVDKPLRHGAQERRTNTTKNKSANRCRIKNTLSTKTTQTRV